MLSRAWERAQQDNVQGRLRERLEEEPEEPDTEPATPAAVAAAAPMVVGAAPGAGVEFEYRTEVLTAEQVLDGTTLPETLAKESKDGWDLVDLLQAQQKHVILLRKPKKPERAERHVGFFAR